MKSITLFCLVLCLGGAGSRALASDLPWSADVRRLTTLLRTSASSSSAESFPLHTLSQISFDRSLALEQLRAVRLAVALAEFTSSSAEARNLAHQLLPLVKLDVDQAAVRVAATLRDDLASALRTAVAATESKQLTPILERFRLTMAAANRYSDASAELSRLHAAALLVESTLEQLGNLLQEPVAERRAAKIHAFFRGDLDYTAVLPRSELLALLARTYPLLEPDPNRSLKAGAALDAKVRQLLGDARRDPESLSRVRMEIQSLVAAPNSPARTGGTLANRYSWTQQALSQLERSYELFKQGMSLRLSLTDPDVSVLPRPTGPFEQFARDEILEIETALVKKVIPRVLLLPEAEIPRPDETSLTFLNRIFREAVAKEDWDLAKRALSLSDRWYFWGAIPTADSVGIRRFLFAAQRAHDGRLDEASYQYLFSLQSGSTLVPVDRIAAELSALRRDHPAEFNAGASQASDAIFVQSLVWRYKPWSFASFLVPIDDRRENAPFSSGIRQMDLDVPALPAKP